MDARLSQQLSDLKDDMWWMKEANCRNMDVELFFLEEQTGRNYSDFAKEVCNTCDVSQQCLDYANKNMFDYGMFGGMSPNERKRYRGRFPGVSSQGARGNGRTFSDITVH